MRKFLLLSMLLIGFWAEAQMPETIVTSRSIVVMDLPLSKVGEYMTRNNWEQKAEEIQKYLSLMGVDAIAYLHSDDWNASPASKTTFQKFFQKRQVTHLLIFSQNEDNLYEVEIKGFDDFSNKWKTTGGSLHQVLFRIGKEIKKRDFVVENFLSPSFPEIVTDVPFSKWTASTTFPDQIKRLTIGVAQFQNEDDNRKLKELMLPYPFKYEFFDYVDDEDAFRKGYQYVLVHMGTAGESIKNLLNYRTGINETDYISTVQSDSTATRLKTIPIDAFVHKFYFRQTVNHEALVGRQWDADVTWEQSLANFILNLRIAFRKI
ncbi:MAG: hypothetical protein GY816_01445 [Cytophagales bacterium]|nr:hypothetical protein [Cytophagales bacterium]